ncbi:MAG: hypothetical protein II449_02515 [Prevotella sp.]|nr:hypothetical protein [Prevotella sp.]MBQ2344852.1 hypothetical protein [Prevotella sp.]
MKKKYNDIKNLFDDVEQSSSENPVENGTRQNETSLSSGSNYDGGLEFLEKILGVLRQIENLQGRCADIQKVQENILKRLDDYKDMKVGLSPNDKAILTKLPGIISQQVNQNVGEAADNVKVAITKHTESTLKSVDEACDMRIKKAKRELGADKGIFLSWWNFWSLLLTTILSVSYATYAAFNKCLWNELFERLWLPLLTLIGFIGLVCLNVWINYKDIKDTRP